MDDSAREGAAAGAETAEHAAIISGAARVSMVGSPMVHVAVQEVGRALPVACGLYSGITEHLRQPSGKSKHCCFGKALFVYYCIHFLCTVTCAWGLREGISSLGLAWPFQSRGRTQRQ